MEARRPVEPVVPGSNPGRGPSASILNVLGNQSSNLAIFLIVFVSGVVAPILLLEFVLCIWEVEMAPGPGFEPGHPFGVVDLECGLLGVHRLGPLGHPG